MKRTLLAIEIAGLLATSAASADAQARFQKTIVAARAGGSAAQFAVEESCYEELGVAKRVLTS